MESSDLKVDLLKPILTDSEHLWYSTLPYDFSNITFDDVFESIPISFFHFRLLLLCGLAFMADSMEVSLLSFVSMCAGEEWNLSNAQIASITSAVFAGEVLGSFVWGPIADMFGRRMSFGLAYVLITTAGK